MATVKQTLKTNIASYTIAAVFGVISFAIAYANLLNIIQTTGFDYRLVNGGDVIVQLIKDKKDDYRVKNKIKVAILNQSTSFNFIKFSYDFLEGVTTDFMIYPDLCRIQKSGCDHTANIKIWSNVKPGIYTFRLWASPTYSYKDDPDPQSPYLRETKFNIIVLPPSFDYSISVDKQRQEIIQGGSMSSIISVKYLSGIPGDVKISIENPLPNYLDFKTSFLSCNPGKSSCNIDLTASSKIDVPPGDYKVTVIGKYYNTVKLTSFNLSVAKVPPLQFKVNLEKTYLHIKQGASLTNTIKVEYISGIPIDVNLNIVNSFPQHITTYLSRNSCNPNKNYCNVIILITANPYVPVDIYNFTVLASAGEFTENTDFKVKVEMGNPLMDFSIGTEGDKTITQGGVVSNNVTAKYNSGMPVVVDFSVDNPLPDYLTFNFNPSSCNPGNLSCTASLLIKAKFDVPIGKYVISVFGKTNNNHRMTSFVLTVVQGGAVMDFKLESEGDKIVSQGSVVSNNIKVVYVAGEPRVVTLSVVNPLPDYFTITSNPSSCNPGTSYCTSVISVVTKNNTPEGVYSVYVNGILDNMIKTTSFKLTVTPYKPPFDFLLTNSGDQIVASNSWTTNTITITYISGNPTTTYFIATNPNPNDLTFSFNPSSCYSGNSSCSSILTITALSTAKPGVYPVTVAARTQDGMSKTTSFKLTVTDYAPHFDFSLATNGDKSVNRGNIVINQIKVSYISGTPSDVKLSASNPLPNYIILSFEPSKCNPGSSFCTSNLSIEANPYTPLGVYSIGVTGLSGSTSKSISFKLTVKDYIPAFEYSLETEGDRTIAVGTSLINTVKVNYISGQPDLVRFMVTNPLPEYFTILLNPNSCNPGTISCSAVLIIDSTSSSPLGTYKVSIIGSTNNSSKETSFYVTLIENPKFDFSLKANTSMPRVRPNSSVAVAITATHTAGKSSDKESISFQIIGLPQYADAIFSSVSCLPTCYTLLKIKTAYGTPLGKYNLTILGR
ncbi:MAG: hypothetical protein QW303_06585, partial [Nitrososphaerota archaeon]